MSRPLIFFAIWTICKSHKKNSNTNLHIDDTHDTKPYTKANRLALFIA